MKNHLRSVIQELIQIHVLNISNMLPCIDLSDYEHVKIKFRLTCMSQNDIALRF